MTTPSAGTVSVATLYGIADMDDAHEIVWKAALRNAADQLTAQSSRVKRLEGAVQQAADLIMIPASYHEVAPTGITGMPRFSYGAMVHNRACAELLPVLKAALADGAGTP